MALRFIRFPEVKTKTGKSRTSIWRDERAGQFPARRRIGSNSVAWMEQEVDAWIEAQIKLGTDKAITGAVKTASEKNGGRHE